MSDELVLRDDADGVATLTLNRPDKLNALNPSVFIALRGHLEAIATDDAVRVVVLTGAGRSFCAGHDLGAIAEHERAPSRHYESETVDALEQLAKPTIAKIKGHCFTGGLELALGCDFLVAAETAQLGDTHGQWGLAPVWGMSVRLPERVGVSKAKELMFTSRRVRGDVALGMGLVDYAVPELELDVFVASFAAEIAANSPGTNRIDKQLLLSYGSMTREESLLHERTLPFGLPEDMGERMSGASGSKKK